MSSLSPAYKAGLSARNRLTDARDEVHRLREHLPDEKRSAVIALYNQLCSVQGTLEALLDDVPTILPDADQSHLVNGNRKVLIQLPGTTASVCLPVTKVDWTSDEGQPFVTLHIHLTDAQTVASETAPTEREAHKQLRLRVVLALKLQQDVLREKIPGLPKLPRQYDPSLNSEA